MESSPAAAAAASSRPREPLLLGNFDLPASWGCRKPMAFRREQDRDTDDDAAPVAAAEPNAANTAAAAAEGGKDSGPRSPAQQAAPVAGEEAAQQEAPSRRQWNLRERTSWRDYRAEDARPVRKLWSTDAAAAAAGVSRGFPVSLTRQEIDADFVAITGRKAPRRPRKRTKSVQRKIETLCPGSLLTEVTRDRYKVNEKGGF